MRFSATSRKSSIVRAVLMHILDFQPRRKLIVENCVDTFSSTALKVRSEWCKEKEAKEPKLSIYRAL